MILCSNRFWQMQEYELYTSESDPHGDVVT